MIVSCEQCNASFNLNESLLKPLGSMVRCSKCSSVFMAYPPAAQDEPVTLTEVVPDPEAEEVTEDAVEELDLGLDLGAEEEKAPETAKVAEDAIEDLELELDMDMEPEAEPVSDEAAVTATEEPDELDLSDFEELLDAEEDTETKDELELELDMDMEFEAEPVFDEAAVTATEEPDELDLSDLEALLDFEEDTETKDEVELEDIELELDMDMEPEIDTPPEDVSVAESDVVDLEELSELEEMFGLDMDDEAAADDTIEDLAMELDLETEEVADDAIEDLAMELDLETEEVADDAIEDLELELDMDIGPEAEPVSDEAAVTATEEPDELDLSDLEELLDIEEDTEAKDEVELEDIELELDMDMEPEIDTTPEDVSVDEIALSDLEEMLDIEEDTEAKDEVELEDFELELDMDDEAAAVDLSEDELDEGVELEFEDALTAGPENKWLEETIPEDFFEDTHVMEPGELLAAAGIEEEEEEKEEEEAWPVHAKKKRLSMPVLIVLVVVLLAGAGYGTLTFLNSKNIRIPFISDMLFELQVEDAGNLMITPLGVNGKFVENTKTGQLYVITGRVKNDYSHNRRFIKVAGKLFTKDKVAAKTATVFCGNFLSDIELSNFDLAAINKRLMNRYGDKKANLIIKPGQMIPFMIVFSNLPNNLDEFSVEVAESMQG
jgi:pilus assembly protein FimV